ncbi:MAG: Ig-like domain-containing protein [Prolixibacteraceae bacterium]|nr:Ig-like domain-containing protein [Prolixibacteraceae bacterium]
MKNSNVSGRNIREIVRNIINGCIFFGIVAGSIFFIGSCANPGAGPTGGPRDSIAPVVLNTFPKPLVTNFNGSQIQVDFNEYVVANTLSNSIVISPPLAKRTNVRTKGRSVIIKLDEDLVPGRTYSIDFKDGIKDYNEGNVLEGFRMLFSTYDQIDTLRISGYLVDAFKHEPVEKATVTLYSIDHDSVFSTLRPDFIAKPDEDGFFLFDNLPEDAYRLFGLVDDDRDLMYSKETEQIAFIDSLIFPSAKYVQQIDTIFEENDTLISKGYTEYSPGQISTYLFTEDYFEQFIDESKRERRNTMLLVFNESLTDSFAYEVIGVEDEHLYVEFGLNRDSVLFWLTDTIAAKTDSLYLALNYTVTDTINRFVSRIDTVNMFFSERQKTKKSRKADEELAEPEKQLTFSFSTNLKPNNVELNSKVYVQSPDPLRSFSSENVRLEEAINDSTYNNIPFTVVRNGASKRKYGIDFNFEEQTTYRLTIDSASIETLSGLHNLKFSVSFKTRALDYYGTAIFKIESFSGSAIIQVLSNDKNEKIVKEIRETLGDKEITLAYLPPGRYRFKLIDDRNNNGKWDTGNYDEAIQPEMVYYFPKVLDIKSNWEIKENWEIDRDNVLPKDIYDAEAEKEEKQAAAEQGRR